MVTDSANNEKKTNRLEGNKVHVPCLAHIPATEVNTVLKISMCHVCVVYVTHLVE